MRPPERVRLPDGDFNLPSPIQVKLWQRWEAYWRRVGELKRDLDAKLIAVFNGDLFEGDHHGTIQIVSKHPEPAAYIAARTFGGDTRDHEGKDWGSPVTDAGVDEKIIVRGTEAHAGPIGASEESFARSIRATPHPETHTWSWWAWRPVIHGVRWDFRHHPGTSGRLPHTRGPGFARLAEMIWREHAGNGLTPPHFASRGHIHIPGDSGPVYIGGPPLRVFVTPSWKIKDSHVHKVASEAVPICGGFIHVMYPDKKPEDVLHIPEFFYPEPEGYVEWTPSAPAIS